MRRCLPLILLALGLAACQSAPPSGGVLLQDDFSRPDSGWDAQRSSEAITDYDGGRYLIGVEEIGVDVWATPDLDLADVDLSVEAAYTAGPVNNEFGLLCRYQRSGENHRFYFFFVSSDGYYALGKVLDNVRTILSPADWQPSSAILTEPGSVNRLRAVCAGAKMTFWVNDSLLGEFEDAELKRGDVGLIAGTYDEGGVRIHFDNFDLRQP